MHHACLRASRGTHLNFVHTSPPHTHAKDDGRVKRSGTLSRLFDDVCSRCSHDPKNPDIVAHVQMMVNTPCDFVFVICSNGRDYLPEVE